MCAINERLLPTNGPPYSMSSSGFFLTVSAESMLKVAGHAVDTGKVFAMNLSAPFLAEFFMEPMDKVIIPGNRCQGVHPWEC